MQFRRIALTALLTLFSAFHSAPAASVDVNVDAAVDGFAAVGQTLVPGGVIEIGWLAPGTTMSQVQALVAAGDFAGLDAVFTAVAVVPFPNAAVDFDSGGGQYFESVTVVPDGNAAALAAYKDPVTGAAGKDWYSWIRDSVAPAGTTQMAFLDGVGRFPTANDNVLFSDFADTFAHSTPPAGLAVWVGSIDNVIVGSQVDNLGGGNAAGDGTGATGSTNVLVLAATSSTATLAFESAAVNAPEEGGPVTLVVKRTGSMSGTATVMFTTNNGTAMQPADYTTTSGTLTFAPNDDTENIVVPIPDRAGFQGDRDFTVTLSSPGVDAELGSPATATVTIVENEVAMRGAIQLSSATYSVGETGGMVLATVQRVGGTDGAVSATFATGNQSATAGADYTAVMQSVSFADGDGAAKMIPIPILDDGAFEGNETFAVTLSAPTGMATLGTPASAVVTIVENEAPPAGGTISFLSGTFAGAEDAGTITVTVMRAGGNFGAVSAQYATSDGTALAPGDYAATSGMVNWADGESGTRTFTVPVVDNMNDAADKTFNVTLSNPTGTASLVPPSTAVVSIQDEDIGGALAFSSATASANENGGPVTLTINRTGGTDGAVSVLVNTGGGTATAGTDYTALTDAVVNFADGQASATVQVAITNNATFSGDRTFEATLSGPTNGATVGTPAMTTVTIVEDDVAQAGTIAFAAALYTAFEEQGTAKILVERTGGSDVAVTVRYSVSAGSATAGSDFEQQTGILNFPVGKTTKTIVVNIVDDGIAENNETVNLALFAPTNGATLGTPRSAALRIRDTDKSATVRLSSETYSTEESGPASIVLRRSGARDQEVTVRLTTKDGTAIAPDDYIEQDLLVTFGAGETTKTVEIPTRQDDFVEGPETFKVKLVQVDPTSPAVLLGEPKTAVVTIARSDAIDQPDVQSSQLDRQEFVGDEVYNTTGTGQISTLAAKAGSKARFSVRIENDGNFTDSYLITGTDSGTARGASVKYFRNGVDITPDVTSPEGYMVEDVKRRGTVDLVVEVKFVGGRQFTGYGALVSAASINTPEKKDAVRVIAIIR